METLEININPQNLEPVVNLYKEIFKNTTYDKDTEILLLELKNKVEKGDLILVVESEKFSYPLAFAILLIKGETLVIEYAGVKEGFRNQGIWSYLYDFIEDYAQKNYFTELGIENNPTLFPQMDKFIQNNHFKEFEKTQLLNGEFSISYIKNIEK